MAQESGLWLRPDRVWIGHFDRFVYSGRDILFLYRIWDHSIGMLVRKEKIIGICLSLDEYNAVDKQDKE